ncbi:MAG: MFS transporter [Comamonadaceae bacterium]|nr:MAG: MFS transporter [Comamonadaceae bacterium]
MRSLRATVVGNVLEWFDWAVYATFSPYIARALFAPTDPLSGLLQTLAIFAIGFVARPLGGWLFGRFADRRGRRASLVRSMMMMAAASLAIALIPSYEVLGAGASALLLAARIVQGLAHGGESAAAYVYVSELAPPRRRGLWSSSVFVSISLGVILASLMGVLLTSTLTPQQIGDWGWRVPFVMGGIVGVYAYYLRRATMETTVFEDRPAATRAAGTPADSGSVWSSLRLVVILGASNVVYAVWLSFASAYAISVMKVPAAEAFRASLGAQVLGMIALPLFGALSDRIGRKPLALFTCGGFALLSFWLTGLLNASAWSLFVAQSIALVMWAALGSVWPAIMAEHVSTGSRAATVGLVSSLGAALFGGTAPYLNTWLTGLNMRSTFTTYTVVLNVVAVLLILTLRETRGIDLRTMRRSDEAT